MINYISRPAWLADVQVITTDGDHDRIDHHRRHVDEGGSFFMDVHSAKRWCETKMAELLGGGTPAWDLIGELCQGRFTWPDGEVHLGKFEMDVPTYSFTGRPRSDGTWDWKFTCNPPLAPERP